MRDFLDKIEHRRTGIRYPQAIDTDIVSEPFIAKARSVMGYEEEYIAELRLCVAHRLPARPTPEQVAYVKKQARRTMIHTLHKDTAEEASKLYAYLDNVCRSTDTYSDTYYALREMQDQVRRVVNVARGEA